MVPAIVLLDIVFTFVAAAIITKTVQKGSSKTDPLNSEDSFDYKKPVRFEVAISDQSLANIASALAMKKASKLAMKAPAKTAGAPVALPNGNVSIQANVSATPPRIIRPSVPFPPAVEQPGALPHPPMNPEGWEARLWSSGAIGAALTTELSNIRKKRTCRCTVEGNTKEVNMNTMLSSMLFQWVVANVPDYENWRENKFSIKIKKGSTKSDDAELHKIRDETEGVSSDYSLENKVFTPDSVFDYAKVTEEYKAMLYYFVPVTIKEYVLTADPKKVQFDGFWPSYCSLVEAKYGYKTILERSEMSPLEHQKWLAKKTKPRRRDSLTPDEANNIFIEKMMAQAVRQADAIKTQIESPCGIHHFWVFTEDSVSNKMKELFQHRKNKKLNDIICVALDRKSLQLINNKI